MQPKNVFTTAKIAIFQLIHPTSAPTEVTQIKNAENNLHGRDEFDSSRFLRQNNS